MAEKIYIERKGYYLWMGIGLLLLSLLAYPHIHTVECGANICLEPDSLVIPVILIF